MKKILSFALVLSLFGLLCSCGKEHIYMETVFNSDVGIDSEAPSLDSSNNPIGNADIIYVQISGAVMNPGVYELSEGARVYQLVEMAGGFTDDAAADIVNQVDTLTDGRLVRIPTISESMQTYESESLANSGLININTASKADLMTLPGIGESKADAILSYRENNGVFSSIDDLCNVPGIKDGTISKFRDKIIAR